MDIHLHIHLIVQRTIHSHSEFLYSQIKAMNSNLNCCAGLSSIPTLSSWFSLGCEVVETEPGTVKLQRQVLPNVYRNTKGAMLVAQAVVQ